MRASSWTAGALGALLVTGLAPAASADDPEAGPAPRWTAEQQAVIDAVGAGPVGIEDDFDGWADGYHADWTYWRVGDASVRGRSAHMGLVRDYIEGGARVESFEMEPADVLIRGDTALLRYSATETLREADGAIRVVRYASADLLAREDGAWRVLATNIAYLPASED